METPTTTTLDQKSTISTNTSTSSLLFFKRTSSHKKKHHSKPAVVSPDSSQPLLSPSSSSSSTPKMKYSKHDDSASQISTASSRRTGARVARLASMFSSRAVVKSHNTSTAGNSNSNSSNKAKPKTESKKTVAKPQSNSTNSRRRQPQRRLVVATTAADNQESSSVPPSPSRSSVTDASSAYVGWPGTQDKRGTTVKMESSYDDSSAGGNSSFRMNYEQELEKAAEAEVQKWMNTEGPEKLTPLERRIIHGPVEESEEEEESDGDENPADFHLAAIVADAAAAASSPLAQAPQKKVLSPKPEVRALSESNTNHSSSSTYMKTQQFLHNSRLRQSARSVAGRSAVSSASGAISIKDLFSDKSRSVTNQARRAPSYVSDPWDVDSSSQPSSSPATSVSNHSSLYFNANGAAGALPGVDEAAAKRVVRPRPGPLLLSSRIRPPTEEALKENERLTPPHRAFNASNIRGYRGFLDKTRDVPNLMDGIDSDSMTSSRATSTFSSAVPSQHDTSAALRAAQSRLTRKSNSDIKNGSDASDVFDGLSYETGGTSSIKQPPKLAEKPQDELNVVVLPSGLASIQTPQKDFDNRQTSAEYDETLTNSEVDQYGFIKLPKFELTSGGKKKLSATFAKPLDGSGATSDSSNGDGRRMRQTIGKPERILDTSTESESSGSFLFNDPYQGSGGYTSPYSQTSATSQEEGDLSMYYVPPNLVKKLVRKYRKMSSRANLSFEQIQVEEDAKKAFALFEMRSRIMEKDMDRGLERQGGTVLVDDLVLTPYNQAAQRVRDAVIVSKAWRDGASPKDAVTASLLTRRAERAYFVERPTFMEEVEWMDDTDFMQYRCPSLGPRCMRGFEMFTIGDCQSILLKLTNERCLQLRAELNDATARQIEAEELMKDEENAVEDEHHGMMTEAEMTYLTAMEEVKALSKQLVVAERSFHLVRDRIEQLVQRYETLLVRIENESVAASSVITFESSYYSDDYSSHYDAEQDREKELLARRAQRAEIKAELAAREAMLAKEEAQKNLQEKQRELEDLQQRLLELQSEPSHAIPERDHSVILAKAIAANSNAGRRSPGIPSALVVQQRATYQGRIEGVKQKFRDRMAERTRTSPNKQQQQSQSTSPRNNLLSGDEMFQYLDFYERSLKAVENHPRPENLP